MMLKWIWLSVALIVLDQITKQLVMANFVLGESITVIPMFDLTRVHNTGAAFGILSSAGGWQRWFFAIIALVVSLGITFWLKKLGRDKLWEAIGLALVLAGAVGNLWDRVAYGYVVDFLDFYYGSSHWPAFNVADMAIVIGAGILIIDALRPQKQS